MLKRLFLNLLNKQPSGPQSKTTVVDNTLDFVRIQTESMKDAMERHDVDAVVRLLPTYVRDVDRLLGRVSE